MTQEQPSRFRNAQQRAGCQVDLEWFYGKRVILNSKTIREGVIQQIEPNDIYQIFSNLYNKVAFRRNEALRYTGRDIAPERLLNREERLQIGRLNRRQLVNGFYSGLYNALSLF